MPEAHIAQEVCVNQNVLEISSRNGQADALVRADGNENGVETSIKQVI